MTIPITHCLRQGCGRPLNLQECTTGYCNAHQEGYSDELATERLSGVQEWDNHACGGAEGAHEVPEMPRDGCGV